MSYINYTMFTSQGYDNTGQFIVNRGPSSASLRDHSVIDVAQLNHSHSKYGLEIS